jgi:hypothetical protein
MFSLQQNWRRGQNRFWLEAEWEVVKQRGEGAQTKYTHVSKCQNDERKKGR